MSSRGFSFNKLSLIGSKAAVIVRPAPPFKKGTKLGLADANYFI